MLNWKKARFKKRLIWIMLQSIFSTSGTGIKPKVSSWPKRERERKEAKRRKRSDHILYKFYVYFIYNISSSVIRVRIIRNFYILFI